MIGRATTLFAACLALLALAACGASPGDAAVSGSEETSEVESDLGNPIWD